MALGASNLTRGFRTVVATARAEWGPDVEVLAALGHGRSYGSESRFIVRTLPGILQSELWSQLSRMPPARTLALVTDVGNDILYGFDPVQILAWVEEAVDRLQERGAEVVLTGLPRVGVHEIHSATFLFFRSVFFPRCRLSFADVSDAAARVNEGLELLATKRTLRFVRLQPEWYGIDPIHIRPSMWRAAWQEILRGQISPVALGTSRREGVRLYLMRPARQRLCGLEFGSPQEGACLKAGGRVWLY